FDLLVDLWRAQAPAGATLLLVGDDERIGRWQRDAPRNVVVAGPRSDVDAVLAAADVVCVPSRQEAFGNVVLEACAAGVPVVTSRRAGAALGAAGRRRAEQLPWSAHDDALEAFLGEVAGGR